MKKIFVSMIMIFLVGYVYSQEKGDIDGFGSIKWGSALINVKGSVIGKITYTDEKKVIISRDGDIEYLYGFFYKGAESEDIEEAPKNAAPAETAGNKANEPAAGTEGNEKISQLFYVSLTFPYLAKDDVKKKIEEKYGESTGEDLKDNKGAIVWNAGNTTIIMWVDSYEKKPYCMKINYLSKDIIGEVANYQKMAFNAREIEVLKKLIQQK